MNIIIFIAVIVVLILVHELGHFLAAKKTGMRVDEFCIGFPPRIFSKQKGETKYSLGMLPLGGFVKIYGEDGEEENNLKDPIAFTNKSRPVQALVLFAGVFFNILLAWIIFSVVFFAGMEMSTEYKSPFGEFTNKKLNVLEVLENGPAQKAGIKENDVILSLVSNGDTIESSIFENLNNFVSNHADKEIEITYNRSGEILKTSLKPTTDLKESDEALLGIATYESGLFKVNAFLAPLESAYFTVNTTVGITIAFFDLLKDTVLGNGSLDNVAGPVGIFEYSSEAYKAGFTELLSFLALISINLAIINMIPVPALDGGRLLVLGVEGIRKRKLNHKIVNYVNFVSFLLLLVLMVLVTISDVFKIVG